MPLPHVHNSDDLVTPRNKVRDGFLEQAIEKTEIAKSFVQEAHQLWEMLHNAAGLDDLIENREIQNELLAATSFSDKSQAHFTQSELDDALEVVLRDIVEAANEKWQQEILYRFLLTRGDSLGGSMRNITGALAGKRFKRALLDAFSRRLLEPAVDYSPSNPEKVTSIRWENRMLVFDKTPNFIKKNIDVILLDTLHHRADENKRFHYSDDFVACGELKGGIDPAGADEHWKTANSALDRIRQSFSNNPPKLFFMGAAIEPAMAAEIFEQLKNDSLAYAANLTIPEQVQDLTDWLIEL